VPALTWATTRVAATHQPDLVTLNQFDGRPLCYKVLVAGLLGGIVLVAWTFVVNGVLGFNRSINMKRVPRSGGSLAHQV